MTKESDRLEVVDDIAEVRHLTVIHQELAQMAIEQSQQGEQ
jgi:hypothetical protein